MAVYKFYDPGIKDSMDALGGIMQAVGQSSRDRQDHEMNVGMIRTASDMSLTPEKRLSKMYDEMVNFKTQRAPGIRGGFQAIGDMFAPPSNMLNKASITAMDRLEQEIGANQSMERALELMERKIPLQVDQTQKVGETQTGLAVDRQGQMLPGLVDQTQKVGETQTGLAVDRQGQMLPGLVDQTQKVGETQTGVLMDRGEKLEPLTIKAEERAAARDLKKTLAIEEAWMKKFEIGLGKKQATDEKALSDIQEARGYMDNAIKSGRPLGDVLRAVREGSVDEAEYKQIVAGKYMEAVQANLKAKEAVKSEMLNAKDETEKKRLRGIMADIDAKTLRDWGATHSVELKKADIY